MTKVCHSCRLSAQWRERFAMIIKKGFGFLVGLLFIVVGLSKAFATDFQIQPTFLDLGVSVKSGAFSVINNSDEKIDIQISVKEWSQDSVGKDVYEDTNDIVFFPKIMSVEPFGQRAIRIGVKAPPSQMEKTYRLFVEEIPSPNRTTDMNSKGNIRAGLTIAFRFATPIFVKPVRPQESYIIERVEMTKGVVRAIVKNTGNVHVKLRAVTFRGKAADGKELYSKEFAGWYILHGLSLPYESAIPQELCGKLAVINVSAQTENLNINGTLNVQKNMCSQ